MSCSISAQASISEEERKRETVAVPEEDDSSSTGGDDDDFMTNVERQNAGKSYAQCAPTEKQFTFWWVWEEDGDVEVQHYTNAAEFKSASEAKRNEYIKLFGGKELWFCPKTNRPFLNEGKEENDDWVRWTTKECEQWIKMKNEEELQRQEAEENINNTPQVMAGQNLTEEPEN